jgi:Uma2 family endonuclease
MSTAATERPLTYEEERGKPMPSFNHAVVQMSLGIEFSKHREYRVASELSLELDGQPLTPDLSVYRREPVDMRHDIIRRTDPPLVTVEILSPTQGSFSVMEKVEQYLKAGVKTCWFVNPPTRTITIYSADGTDRTFLPGQQAVDPAIGITADVTAVFS